MAYLASIGYIKPLLRRFLSHSLFFTRGGILTGDKFSESVG
jgi:hypothetical protein